MAWKWRGEVYQNRAEGGKSGNGEETGGGGEAEGRSERKRKVKLVKGNPMEG